MTLAATLFDKCVAPRLLRKIEQTVPRAGQHAAMRYPRHCGSHVADFDPAHSMRFSSDNELGIVNLSHRSLAIKNCRAVEQ
jgi:hypothetical protein